jgi:hypothetical protein
VPGGHGGEASRPNKYEYTFSLKQTTKTAITDGIELEQLDQEESEGEDELEGDQSASESEAQSKEDSDAENQSILVQPKAGTFIGLPMPETKLAKRTKSHIHRLLESAETPGEFISSSVTQVPVNPGLEIDGFGILGLPISRQSVETLSKHLDTTYPSCNQQGCLILPEDAITFTHPEWSAALFEIGTK